jgi:PAS domain S-box-containing protein
LKSPEVVDIFQQVAMTGVSYRADEYAYILPNGEDIYWNWVLDAIRDESGAITHLLQSVQEVTDLVHAYQRAEQEKIALEQEKRKVEVDHYWLRVVETVAHSVSNSLDSQQIGRVATQVFHTYFQVGDISLYTINAAQHTLRLLYADTVHPGQQPQLRRWNSFPYWKSSFMTQLLTQREPIVFEHAQDICRFSPDNLDDPFDLETLKEVVFTQSCIFAPLWFHDQCEGILIATFPRGLSKAGAEMHAFQESCRHIVSALALARQHSETDVQRGHLLSVLDQLPEGILLIDVATGMVSYSNIAAATLLGLPLPKLIGRQIHAESMVMTGKQHGKPLTPWNFAVIRSLAGETIHSREMLVNRPDGSSRVVLVSSAPLYAQSHSINGAIVVLQDVTAQKKLEQQRNDFFWMANHELRTPITIIQGFAELLQLQKAVEANKLEHDALTHIMEQSDHLLYLIEEMFDLSSIEHDQFVLQQRSQNILPLIARVVDSLTTMTHAHTIHLRLPEAQHQRDAFISLIDEKRMVQVLRNLLNNAIKYSPNGGDIEIGVEWVERGGAYALIWIKDQGIGIAESDKTAIFQRFRRGESLDPAISGLGIGLFLVKEIVQKHNGLIWVESEPGQGSCFYILLPLVA